jgi:hypothetical protein
MLKMAVFAPTPIAIVRIASTAADSQNLRSA